MAVGRSSDGKRRPQLGWSEKTQGSCFPLFVVYKPQLFFFCRGPFALPGVALYAPFLFRGVRLQIYFSSAAPPEGRAPNFLKAPPPPTKLLLHLRESGFSGACGGL